MTNVKMRLTFDHTPVSAVQASLDALALAIAWLPRDSDDRGQLGEIQSGLQTVQESLSRSPSIRTQRMRP